MLILRAVQDAFRERGVEVDPQPSFFAEHGEETARPGIHIGTMSYDSPVTPAEHGKDDWAVMEAAVEADPANGDLSKWVLPSDLLFAPDGSFKWRVECPVMSDVHTLKGNVPDDDSRLREEQAVLDRAWSDEEEVQKLVRAVTGRLRGVLWKILPEKTTEYKYGEPITRENLASFLILSFAVSKGDLVRHCVFLDTASVYHPELRKILESLVKVGVENLLTDEELQMFLDAMGKIPAHGNTEKKDTLGASDGPSKTLSEWMAENPRKLIEQQLEKVLDQFSSPSYASDTRLVKGLLLTSLRDREAADLKTAVKKLLLQSEGEV